MWCVCPRLRTYLGRGDQPLCSAHKETHLDLNKQPKNAAKQTGGRPMPTPARKEEPKVQPATPAMPLAVNATVSAKDAHREAWANLEVVLNAALDVAYSENLPADYPGKERTVEVRRRHWMYMAAVSFATYNPVLALDEEAVPEAVALAHDLMADRDAAITKQTDKDNRVRRMNGLPPTADSAKPTGVAAVMVKQGVAAPAKAYDQALARGVEVAMAKLIAAGQKFTDAHVEKNPRLKVAAVEYADRYTGNLPFVADVRRNLDVRPELRVASITVPQARGLLNVWLSEARNRPSAGK